MLRKLFFFSFVIVSFFCIAQKDIFASYGISPADLTINNLLQGEVYEKQFLISRTDLDNDLNVVVETDIQGADDWLKFEPGIAFTISKGQRTKKMKVIVDVPKDIPLKVYQGYFYVKNAADENASGVTVVGGVGVAVRLGVGENEVNQLLVRNMEMLNVYEEKPLVLLLSVENQGNVKSALEEVEILVTDISSNEVLKTEGKDFTEILPGRLDELAVKFDNNLTKGEYFADVTVYFKGDIIKKDKLSFSISESVKEERDIGKIKPYCIINILLVSVVIIILILLTMALRKYLKRVIYQENIKHE